MDNPASLANDTTVVGREIQRPNPKAGVRTSCLTTNQPYLSEVQNIIFSKINDCCLTSNIKKKIKYE